MARVYCRYDLNLNTRNFRFSGLPIGVFNFSVKWHPLLVFVDQLGVTTNFQDTKLYESNQSLVMPLYILQSQFLFARHMERALDALHVHRSFFPDIVRLILDTVFRGSDNGHRQFNMSINLELVIKEEVEEESIEDVSLGGYESDAERVTQRMSRKVPLKSSSKRAALPLKVTNAVVFVWRNLKGAENRWWRYHVRTCFTISASWNSSRGTILVDCVDAK